MFGGVTAALVTPLDERGELDESGMERLLKRVVSAGVTAVSPAGSTGEGPRLGWARRQRVTRLVRALVPPDMPVLAGVNVTAVGEAVAELEHVANAGASAALVSPPAYYPASDAELIGLYELLAERSPLPLVLYNIPVFTKVPIPPAVVARLAELPGVVGVKDSSRDLEYLQQVLTRTRERSDFEVLTGTDTMYVASLLAGAAGTVCTSANLAPALSVGIHRAFTAGDLDSARELQWRLADLVAACRSGLFPTGWKAALDIAGVCGPHLAPPALPLPPQLREPLQRRLAELGVTG